MVSFWELRREEGQNLGCQLVVHTCMYTWAQKSVHFLYFYWNGITILFVFIDWCRYCRILGLPSKIFCLARWRRAGLKFWVLGFLIGTCLEIPLFLQKCRNIPPHLNKSWHFWKLGIQILPELFIFSTKLSTFTEALLCIKNLKFRVKTKSIPPSCFMSLMS